MSDALILGFDTSAAHCAAALLCGDRVIAALSEDMTRGQAERLIPLLEDVLAQGGVGWGDLARIGVGVGPGNFTGIRIAVSAARGLALGLGIPAVGVSNFDAQSLDQAGPHLPVVPAPRGQVYAQAPGGVAMLVDLAQASAMGLPLCPPLPPAEMAARIARIAAARDVTGMAPPAPLYLKPADAAPARDQAPTLLE